MDLMQRLSKMLTTETSQRVGDEFIFTFLIHQMPAALEPFCVVPQTP